MTDRRSVLVLGSTGNIGSQAIDVAMLFPNNYVIKTLIGGSNVTKLAQQAIECKAENVIIYDEGKLQLLKELLRGHRNMQIYGGQSAVMDFTSHYHDICISAISGIAGLLPTVQASGHCGILAVANKESIICGGDLFLKEIQKHNCKLIPIDSEHNAVFQILVAASRGNYVVGKEDQSLTINDKKTKFSQITSPSDIDCIKKITITASGGPLWASGRSATDTDISVADAINHPTWKMGPKISVDSATMINKGLEIIEAAYLFKNVHIDDIDAVIHPESIVHGIVHYKDGHVMTCCATPNVKNPISYAMSWPTRSDVTDVRELDFANVGRLHFYKRNDKRFPLLKAAIDAFKAGPDNVILLNASNEFANAAFLRKQKSFSEITSIVMDAMEKMQINKKPTSIHDVVAMHEDVVISLLKKYKL